MEILQLIVKEKISKDVLIPYLEKVLNNKLLFYKEVKTKGLPYSYDLFYNEEGFRTIIQVFLGKKKVNDLKIALLIAKKINSDVLIDTLDEAFEWCLVRSNGNFYSVNEKFTKEECDFIEIDINSMLKINSVS